MTLREAMMTLAVPVELVQAVGSATTRAEALRAVEELRAESERCFRRAARKAHPDTGGSSTAFRRVQEARATMQRAHVSTVTSQARFMRVGPLEVDRDALKGALRRAFGESKRTGRRARVTVDAVRAARAVAEADMLVQPVTAGARFRVVV